MSWAKIKIAANFLPSFATSGTSKKTRKMRFEYTRVAPSMLGNMLKFEPINQLISSWLNQNASCKHDNYRNIDLSTYKI